MQRFPSGGGCLLRSGQDHVEHRWLVYFFEPCDERQGCFNAVHCGYLMHYVQVPYALGAIVSDDSGAAAGRAAAKLSASPRIPQIVVRWKGGRDNLNQLLVRLREMLGGLGLGASYKVYSCGEPRVVVTAKLEEG